ncbi:MAG: galactose-1-phosphate uridylyltransferase [Candidatus Rokuibacteriota bacterium]
MPELRKDPVVGRWVIISTERSRRPSDFHSAAPEAAAPVRCAFCEGQEAQTPPEILAGRAPDSTPNGPGWTFRVVPNKFPALRIEGDLDATGEGMFDRMSGVGAHEVIVETPAHHASFATLGAEPLTEILLAWRERIVDLKKDPRFEYVLIFKNHGALAGASLEHPHSQLIATPIIPVMVTEELAGSAKYYGMKERCVWCDIVRQERRVRKRLVHEAHGFVTLAPFAPRFPFETWILPASHRSAFEESDEEELRGLAEMLGDLFRRIAGVLGDPAFNLMLHTTPLRAAGLDHFHWHVEVIPKLTNPAGFEWGSGFFINPVPPEDAAAALRESVRWPVVSSNAGLRE